MPTVIIRWLSSDTSAQNKSRVMSTLSRGRVYFRSLCLSQKPLTSVMYSHLQTKMFPGCEFI